MTRDSELGLHSIPGQTLDAAGRRDAEAYVARVEDRWRASDARLGAEIAAIDATLRAQACGGPGTGAEPSADRRVRRGVEPEPVPQR